jgi:type IV secretion system protein VirD4
MNGRSSSSAISDTVVLSLMAGLATIAGLVWFWGGVAGSLFGHGWPRLAVRQLPGIIVRLPARLADPALAWPREARRLLPDPAGCYAALALVAAAAWATVLIATRSGLVSRLLGRGARGAHWAARAELNRLRVPVTTAPARTGRLALGRYRGRLLRAEQRHALVAFGPPQSGKSAGLAVPALLEWAGPVVASSIKTDLLAATIERRRTLGPVLVFDPFGLSGAESNTWSPLAGCQRWDGALEAAWRLAAAAELDAKGMEGGDFWAIAAEQRLAPLMFSAARSGLGMDALVRWVYGQGTRELDQTIAQLTGETAGAEEAEDVHAAYDALRAFEAQADRTRTSIEATAQGLLRAYRFRRVLRSAATSEITPDGLLDERATLYLIGDAKASKLLRPVFLALLSAVIDRAYERATRAGGQLADPLLLCLDEAGNVAPLPNLAEVASTAPSHNIQLISIFHDIAQARSRYGRQAETVINSHRARMLLPGVADLETLRYFADLIGEEEARDIARTTGPGPGTRTSSVRRRPLAAAESLRQLPERHALLLYGRMPPAQIELRMWFADRRLRRLAAP